MLEMCTRLQRRSKYDAKGWPDGEGRNSSEDSSDTFLGPETAQHRTQNDDEAAENESVRQAW